MKPKIKDIYDYGCKWEPRVTDIGDVAMLMRISSEEEKERLCDVATTILRSLTPRMQVVISFRLGLDGRHQHTIKEISEKLDIPEKHVRILCAKVVRYMRHPSRSISHLITKRNLQ